MEKGVVKVLVESLTTAYVSFQHLIPPRLDHILKSANFPHPASLTLGFTSESGLPMKHSPGGNTVLPLMGADRYVLTFIPSPVFICNKTKKYYDFHTDFNA